MERFGGATATVAGVALLTGCGAMPTSTTTKTVTETAEPAAEEAAVDEPTDEATVPWSLGEYSANEYQKTRAISVEKASSKYSQLPSDQQWWKAEIETCALKDLDGQTVTSGWSPWGIQGDEGGTYPASDTTWGDFPKPQYPFGSDPIPVGECRKGWVMIALNQGVEPVSVTYSPDGVAGTSWAAE